MGTDIVKMMETIEKLDRTSQSVVITIIQGEGQGEKALLSYVHSERERVDSLPSEQEHIDNWKIQWTTESGNKKNFFRENEKEIQQAIVSKNTLCTIKDNILFIDQLNSEKELVICGAGHVSIPIIQIGKMLGYEVTVIEDRPTFADHARSAKATRVICDDFEQGLRQVTGGANTYFVVVTRGHRHDQICLEQIVPKPHAYIGMMGSSKRTTIVKRALLEKGCDPVVVDQIHTPIGLNIGAETPEEIAISIMAEMIQNRNLTNRSSGYSKVIKKALLEDNQQGKKILATIIRRKGSAPRAVGTKMLLCDDGRTIDTIGGGCLEAQVISKARQMFATKEEKSLIITVDMTRENAEEEGMVCGGIIDVLLELV